MQPPFDRAGWALQVDRHLGLTHVQEMAQDDGGPLFGCELVQGVAHGLARLGGFYKIFRAGKILHQPVRRLGGFIFLVQRDKPVQLFGRIDGGIDHAAQEPRAKGAGFIELPDPFVSPQEGGLDHILRQRPFPDDQVGGVHRLHLVQPDQRFQPGRSFSFKQATACFSSISGLLWIMMNVLY